MDEVFYLGGLAGFLFAVVLAVAAWIAAAVLRDEM